MSGAYCRYCGHRCFVPRLLPADARWMPGKEVHLATCPQGAAHDLERIGYDQTTAVNRYEPGYTDPEPGAPRWADLFGIDPGFTGDLSTAEYLAWSRGEDTP